MVLKLFYDDVCPTSRAVLLTVRALDLAIDLQEVNFFSKEQNSELIKLNPLERLPTLVDDELVISDGHAICAIKQASVVDEKLYFNSNVLLPRLDHLLFPILLFGVKEIPKEKLYALKEGYQILDTFLERGPFLLGETVTIADFCCVSSISTSSILLPVSSEMYPTLFKWYQKCKALPYYDKANGVGLNKADTLIQNKLGGAYCKIIS
ncbi:hypothetical protein PPYR_10337 [Photinus pyralis]|uniref:Uncharacterized protein n=1 Tax=Photinus pyralis TaxID=7054 RepID=A0A5N4AG58_PHOPY|nr:hypothetical protein PPYR_10337 [Photinus pyralis]